MKKRILFVILTCIFIFNLNILDVRAEIDVNSGTQSEDTSESCTGTICASTITNYYGLYVQVCKYNATTNKFSSCTNKKITNKDLTFMKPKSCVTLANGGELNYCWAEYFNQIDEKEVNRLLKMVDSSFDTKSKKDYYMVIQPLVGIRFVIKSSYSSYLAGETTFKGTAREVVKAMYNAGNYVKEATDANLKKAATNLARDFVIKRADGLVYRDDEWQRAKYIGGQWNVLRNYFTTFKLGSAFGPYQTSYNDTDLNNMTAYKFYQGTNYNSNMYGKVIIKILDYCTDCYECNIDINNNDDAIYNWTEPYPCEWDSSQTCWKKIKNGCCDTFDSNKINSNDVKTKYPECSTCEVVPSTTYYDSNGTKLNELKCGNNPVTVTNQKIVTDGINTNTNICLANNKMLTGIVNGIRYGCAITDNLNLPEKHKQDISVGGYFAWPTSKTLQKYEYFDLSYPINRQTIYYCVAYKYNSNGQVTYYSVNDTDVNDIVGKLSVGGSLNLTYEDKFNGNVVKESTNVSKNKNGVNFNATIDTTYTLDTANVAGTYSYYDTEKLEYTTSMNENQNKYKKYGFPIIPLGKFNDISVTANYGLNLQNISATGLAPYSCNTYKCNKSGTGKAKTSEPCTCPPGTEKAGVIIDSNVSAGSAQCAALQATKCDDKKIYCPDGTDITYCVNNDSEGAVAPQTAYGACYAKYCETPPPPPPPPITDKIIYRTIFLNNPFLNGNGTQRTPGSNWGGIYGDSVVNKYITSTKNSMYKGTPMYRITLTPQVIRKIKAYNKDNKYDDFTLECDDRNGRCYSSFIHRTIGSGGTCGNYTFKQNFVANFDSCREESINSVN